MSITAVCVDDSPVELSYIERILTDSGVQVIGKAYDGETGLQMIRDLRPTLAVLDIVLPMLSGVDIAKAIQAEALPSIPVIASGSTQNGIKKRCDEYGVKHFLAKPYDDAIAAVELKPLFDLLRSASEG